jgi:predicted phage-related endonuclease
MKITYYNELLQGTDEWLLARAGIVTASVVKNLLTTQFKIADNKTVTNLVYKLAAERITNFVENDKSFYQMERGHLEETIARHIYAENYHTVEECGFITKEFDNGVILGCSPDGLVNDNGMIEIKSRINKLQIETVISKTTPSEYICQIQSALLVTDREWIDFVSYSNGMPLYIERHTKDEGLQATIIEAVYQFEGRVREVVRSFELNSDGLVQCERVDHDEENEITSSGEE